ncbi:MAG: SH3 domain-containing protein [Bacilli bacterium]|jgi:hypothetical protein
MILLGSKRIITQNFKNHQYAEDYAGLHLSDIKIYGKAKVIHVVNKYQSYKDTINYHDFLNNKERWKEGSYYNCLSIGGNKTIYHQSELGGNEIKLECYYNKKKYYFRLLHLAEVFVKVGDIIDSNTLLGLQGNTGLVLSYKNRNDLTYGTHVHFEITDEDGNYINPREYALFNLKVDYLEQTNEVDKTKRQLKINVDKINIRKNSNVSSSIIGGVYYGEVYTVLEEKEDDKYQWFKIKTNLGLVGYIANEKGKKWLLLYEINDHIEGNYHQIEEPVIKMVFECSKDGVYAINLKKGEKLYIE